MFGNFLLLLIAVFLVFVYFVVLYIGYIRQKKKWIFRDRFLLKILSEFVEKLKIGEEKNGKR